MSIKRKMIRDILNLLTPREEEKRSARVEAALKASHKRRKSMEFRALVSAPSPSDALALLAKAAGGDATERKGSLEGATVPVGSCSVRLITPARDSKGSRLLRLLHDEADHTVHVVYMDATRRHASEALFEAAASACSFVLLVQGPGGPWYDTSDATYVLDGEAANFRETLTQALRAVLIAGHFEKQVE